MGILVEKAVWCKPFVNLVYTSFILPHHSEVCDWGCPTKLSRLWRRQHVVITITSYLNICDLAYWGKPEYASTSLKDLHCSQTCLLDSWLIVATYRLFYDIRVRLKAHIYIISVESYSEGLQPECDVIVKEAWSEDDSGWTMRGNLHKVYCKLCVMCIGDWGHF